MKTSDRQQKRKSYEEFDKKLIRMQKRSNELYKQKRELPLIRLEKPVQKGWRKGFVLREDVARRRDAKDLERILSRINCFVYCDDIDFKSKKFHNKQKEDIPHVLQHIPLNSWDKLQWPEHFKKWFSLETRTHFTRYGGAYETRGYYFKLPWMFVPKVEPHFATHRREVNPFIERELAEIDAFFQHNNGWQRLAKIRHGYNYRDWNDNRKCILIEDIVIKETAREYEINYLEKPE